ncbi:hypothetical protein K7432_010677 [Basidiobolus ranarum]|uniref:VWFA domain-containing protein n=1 Tax=Basidiobolus ranarum TaxID=34480 RepID=A0ABR2WND7_9FUNG
MITSSEKPASVIQAYPTLGGFVCKLDFSDGLCTTARPEIRTIIILDRSGSMEGQVYRFVHTVLPSMLKRLEYSSKDSITLIPFDEQASILECTIDQLYSLNIYQGGGTYMHKAIEKLTEKIAKELESYSSLKVPPLIRILSISDGAIGDQVLTQKLAASLSVTLKNSNLIVNSQAVRLFTSYSQPDTRALSSVLQFNTVNSATLVDVLSSLPDQEISETLASLFRDDGLVESSTLSSTIPVFRLNPWQELPVQSISVRVGENTFWMSELPESCTLSDENVFFSVQESLSWGPYSLLIRNKMELFLQKMRVLKVIDTSHSQIEIDLMLDYFEKLEKSWEPQDPSVNIADGNINGLKSRFSHLKQLILRKKKSIVTTFSQIANDQKVGKLNAAQQADYLRSAELTKRSKGLARRAVSATNGLDFDTVMREEVCAMHTNLHELADVDDSDHNVSFYSQETTLAGIRAVCMLVEENLIDDVDINEVIQLLNLVGIPCSHHIGEYPDPMTFRLSNIMVGSFVSLSDVLVAHIQSNGQILRTPGTNHEISNVIPVFEDERILRFLSKYAPTMLEYTASVGMRRMLADVPLTFAYTSLAGIWRMVEELNLNKSEINIRTFIQLVQNFRIYSAKFFTHITKYLKPQEQCSTISLYLANHGVIDLISPMISRLQDSDFPTVLPALMRALYTFEVWQIIRKMYKNQERSKDIIESALNQLLNVDLDKTRTVPMPLFKEEPAKPTFCRSYERNEDYLDELMKKIAFIDYISLLSPFLEATVRQGLTMEERISLIRDIPTMTDESVSNALGIPYDLRAFKDDDNPGSRKTVLGRAYD